VGELQGPASAAIRKGAQLAEKWGADLELFHALAAPLSLEVLNVGALEETKADGRRISLAYLERLAVPLRRIGLKVSTAVAWDYPPFEAIIRRALAVKADLIVTQSPERHRLAGLLGYTDWELLRLSPMPVLLIKTPRLYRHPTVLAAVDPTHPNAKSGALDRQILDQAAQFSRVLKGSLRAVHAYFPEPRLPAPGLRLNNIIPAAALKAAQREAGRAFAAALPKNVVKPSCQHVAAGSPSEVIAQIAHMTHSAIVVLGAVSRSGLRRLFIGNTAEKVLDDLRCDVLIVKPAKFRPKIARARRGVQIVSTAIPFGA